MKKVAYKTAADFQCRCLIDIKGLLDNVQSDGHYHDINTDRVISTLPQSSQGVYIQTILYKNI